ncbi:MAG: phosphatase PAP2 family protein [Candidatus Aminicenantes bacterium]|nr:phosphatase PAP2 family protein [Candidatus Aminicenantes bacterium]
MKAGESELRGLRFADAYGRSLDLPGLGLQALDALVLAMMLLLAALIVLRAPRIHGPGSLLGRIAFWGLLYVASLALQRRLKAPSWRALLRLGTVQLVLGQVYLISHPLQLIFASGWQDEKVLRLEEALFGAQPTVWLQRFVTPVLTEWMMFCYVFYLVLYPALGLLVCQRWGEKALEDYLFVLALANGICILGFIACPVAGPLYYMADRYTVPLRGWFFASVGEFLHRDVHLVGGNLPSPHCAITTVMWLMAYRYRRRAFWLLAPVMATIYVSTFYGRFHYVSDTLIGIAAGLAVAALAPGLLRGWNRLTGE